MNNDVFKYITYGMYIVGFNNDSKYGGCVINTFSQVTSDGVISINLNKDNYTNEVIRKTKKFSISILSREIDRNIISVFGFSSSKDVDKFKDVSFEVIDDLPVLKDNICGYILCSVIDIIDCGSHDIILAKILKSDVSDSKSVAMTYKYYHEVIKGSIPKKAPTYIEEETLDNEFVCDICGYVVKGEISDDFICPICGANRSHFKKKNN